MWHGYLLGGTDSNIYARRLAREWLPVICRCALLSQGGGNATLTHRRHARELANLSSDAGSRCTAER